MNGAVAQQDGGTNRSLVQLVGWCQPMKFLAVLRRVLAPHALGHDAQTRHAVPESGDLVVEIHSIPLLDHVVGGLLDRLPLLVFLLVLLGLVG